MSSGPHDEDVQRPLEPLVEGRFEIVNNLGLHARAATKLVQLASQFGCDIEIAREGQKANAKSVMGVLLLCGAKGTFVSVRARGPSATEAVAAIGALIAAKFGEAS
jgi:phosphocarrier protein